MLGSKPVQNLAILDWRYSSRYIMEILGCHHQERPSVQQLIKTISHDFVIRLAEPSSASGPSRSLCDTRLTHFSLFETALKAAVDSEGLKLAADQLESLISIPEDKDLVLRVALKAKARVDQKNEAYSSLVRDRAFGTQSIVD